MNKRLGILLEDAYDQLDRRGTIEQDREAILSACIIDKLLIAEDRTMECNDLTIQINYEEVNLDALSKTRSYSNLLDSMISYNNDMYNRVLKIALGNQ